ncbi:MAG: hypothetical protein P9M03_04635 [Candidatus Theseobacter exili]|nr:hypothetical protein [Candidatus Theseobacter exili]
MSVYLGEYLEELFNEIEGIGKITEKKLASITLGVQNLPKVSKDYSDRNRTSPIAFTGNKFEFRAVGSTHNCAESATVFNILAAYGYNEIYNKLSKMKGDAKSNAIMVLKDVLKETKVVRFEGNNYDEAWHLEAEKRGLPNTKNTPAALEEFLKEDVFKVFEKLNILSREELKSKIEIKIEAYNKVKDIEFKTAINIANTLILPAVVEQIASVAGALSAVISSGLKSDALTNEVKTLEKIYSNIKSEISNLSLTLASIEEENNIHKQAYAYGDKGTEALKKLRKYVDAAERVIADDIWPMAKYQELLLEL